MRLSVYRPVGEFGEPYPNWMRDLRDARGVYVIIDLETGEPLWVGESDYDLRKTITRHFQAWDRESRSAQTPHYEYERAGVYDRTEVLVSVGIADDSTSESEIIDREGDLICALQPADNEQKMWRCYEPDPDEAPYYVPSPETVEDARDEHDDLDARWRNRADEIDVPF